MKKFLLTCMLALGIGASAQITVGSGNTTNSTGPWSSCWGYSYHQQLYLQSSINSAGTITSITLTSADTLPTTATGATPNTPQGANTDFKIYIGHTTKTTFTSTTDWVPAAGMTLVYDGTLTMPTASGQQLTINLTTPFTYNNTDNLVIAFDENSAGYACSYTWVANSAQTNMAIYQRSDTVNADPTAPPTGTRASTTPQVILGGLTTSNPPVCTTISAPANNATGVSLTPTISWSAAGGANAYDLAIGTTAGGTDVFPLTDVGNVTSYTLPTGNALAYSSTYYVTVYPKNALGSASGCTSNMFTTAAPPCPTVTAPAPAAADVSLTPTFTWNAVTGATSYTISIGTTSGGTDIMNAVDVGNVTTYTYSGSPALNNSTTYYYTINTLVGTLSSASCTVRNFTTTCNPTTTLPVTENFDTTPTGSTTSTNAPACWRYAEPASWAGSGYVATTQPVSTPNNYHIVTGTATTGGGMLVSPQITPLMNGLNRVRLMAAAGGSGYTMEVGTLSNPSDVSTFTVIGSPISLTTTMTQYTVSIPSGANEYLAFRHAGGGTNRSIRLDDITIEPSPTCDNPTGVNVTSTSTNGATIGWVAPSTPVGIGYDVYYSTSNTAPTASTVLDTSNSVQAGPADTSAPITGLTSDMFYYVWVRAKCSAGDSSAWEGGARFYTSNYCTPTTANQNSWISEFTSTGASTNMNYTSATATSGSTFGYKNLTATHKISVAPSTSDIVIPISLTAGGPTVGFGIWVDFDQNNTFGTGELLYQTTSYITSTSGATITVPANTPVGNYRMRVFMNYNQSVPNDPCLNFTRGEIIDYTLQVDSALGTNEIVSNDVKVKVYPNPFTDILNISDVKNVTSVMVMDMSGRTVKTIAKPTAQLQLGDLKSGLYLVTLKYKDGSVKTVKAIKK